jgi:hypothetical protein
MQLRRATIYSIHFYHSARIALGGGLPLDAPDSD